MSATDPAQSPPKLRKSEAVYDQIHEGIAVLEEFDGEYHIQRHFFLTRNTIEHCDVEEVKRKPRDEKHAGHNRESKGEFLFVFHRQTTVSSVPSLQLFLTSPHFVPDSNVCCKHHNEDKGKCTHDDVEKDLEFDDFVVF